MGSTKSAVVLTTSLFFYILGFIFTITGYWAPWLIPREEYSSGIKEVGLRRACFENNFKFAKYGTKYDEKFNGCYDNTKINEIFDGLQDAVSPDWFVQVQNLHLASLILIFFNSVLIVLFFCAYCSLKRQISRLQRPSSALLIAKAGLALWFILTFIIAVLEAAEPSIFYHNYERNRDAFYDSGAPFDYGAGFGVTIAASVCLIACTIFSLATFCGILRKMIRLAMNPLEKEEFESLGTQDMTEMERLSHDDEDHVDRSKSSEPRVVYKPATKPQPTPRVSTAVNSPSNEPPSSISSQTPESKPVPAKRLSQATSSNKPAQVYQNIPSSSSPRKPADHQGAPALSPYQNVSSQPSSRLTAIDYSNRSMFGSETGSETGSRNISITKSALASDSPRKQEFKPEVVQPKEHNIDRKHSRYSAF